MVLFIRNYTYSPLTMVYLLTYDTCLTSLETEIINELYHEIF